MPEAYQVEIWEDQDLVVMARVKGVDRQLIIQSTLSSISVTVTDLSNGEQVSTALAPSVASTVFDTLQTDARWTKDRTGYNFRYTIPGTYFPSGGRDYWVEVEFTPASGSVFTAAWQVSVHERRAG